MAALNAVLSVANVASTTSAKTILQLVAATHQRVRVNRLIVGLDGTTSTNEPVLIELLRQSSAGTMSTTAPVKRDDLGSETLQTAGRSNASAEPTAGDVVFRTSLHPQSSGVWDVNIVIPGNGRLGLRVTAANAVDVNASIEFEE